MFPKGYYIFSGKILPKACDNLFIIIKQWNFYNKIHTQH